MRDRAEVKSRMRGKNNMKRRLQFRFVFWAVLALVSLQLLIVAFSITRSYRQMTLKADRIIILTGTSPDAPEAANARYFTVTYRLEDRSFDADLTHTALVTPAAAVECAKSVIDGKKDSGYLGDYRYLVRREKGRIRITFLSRVTALEAFRSNAEILVLFSAGGIAVMTVILIGVSGKVVSPLVKNHRKQKEFITSASHELKTPLTVIHADAQLLESEIGENQWLSDIMSQTRHLTEMTRRLVYLARAEEQEGYFVKIQFPVGDVAEEVAGSYRSVAQNSGKKYEVHIQQGLSYCGDERGIRELMTVLLDNAFKYAPAEGNVEVTLKSQGHGVCFMVENTVSQVNIKQLESFTERFYRADNSRQTEGFGIGLSVARAVAEAHRGRLTVELVKEDRLRVTAYFAQGYLFRSESK